MSKLLGALVLVYEVVRIYLAVLTLSLKLRLRDTWEEANLNKYERVLFDGLAERLQDTGNL